MKGKNQSKRRYNRRALARLALPAHGGHHIGVAAAVDRHHQYRGVPGEKSAPIPRQSRKSSDGGGGGGGTTGARAAVGGKSHPAWTPNRPFGSAPRPPLRKSVEGLAAIAGSRGGLQGLEKLEAKLAKTRQQTGGDAPDLYSGFQSSDNSPAPLVPKPPPPRDLGSTRRKSARHIEATELQRQRDLDRVSYKSLRKYVCCRSEEPYRLLIYSLCVRVVS